MKNNVHFDFYMHHIDVHIQTIEHLQGLIQQQLSQN